MASTRVPSEECERSSSTSDESLDSQLGKLGRWATTRQGLKAQLEAQPPMDMEAVQLYAWQRIGDTLIPKCIKHEAIDMYQAARLPNFT